MSDKNNTLQKRPQRITIRDVAKLAGVSPATVSKVLNDAPHVSQESRQRVMSAVAKLDFRPNSIARSLKSRRTLTIGLITDDLEGVFTTSMMRGVEDVTSSRGFSVFLCNSYGNADKERAHLQLLLDKQVDGVILLSGYKVRERGAPALDLGSIPVVYLYQYTRDINVPCIIPDDFGGAEIGTNHLISLGRKRIGLINGPYHYEATHHRLEGYKSALENAGISYDPSLVRSGKWYEDSGYMMAKDLMSMDNPPDALFCCSDSLAAGAIRALCELDIRVPDDIPVVGFDNRPFAAHHVPPLTTVALPLYEMGRMAGEMIVSAILGPTPEPGIHKVPCYLVRRESCGVLKASYNSVQDETGSYS